MSVQRSPTGCGNYPRLSGSQPNLAEIDLDDDMPTNNVTLRCKRKEPDDNAWIRTELSDLKKQMAEMMALIKSSSSSQEENISKLSKDVTAIKNQMHDTGNTIKNIILEHNSMKTTMNNLQTMSESIEKKIDLLESDMNNLKSTALPSTSRTKPDFSCEDIVSEVNERNIRAKNIIIVGIPEPDATTDRHAYNNTEVSQIIKLICDKCPEPLKIIRLGRFRPGHTRPIKVTFSSEEIVGALLRGRDILKSDSVKIYSDQTPMQRKHMHDLKAELGRRIVDGETNLKIKYIKGTPKIIKLTEDQQKEKAPKSKN